MCVQVHRYAGSEFAAVGYEQSVRVLVPRGCAHPSEDDHVLLQGNALCLHYSFSLRSVGSPGVGDSCCEETRTEFRKVRVFEYCYLYQSIYLSIYLSDCLFVCLSCLIYCIYVVNHNHNYDGFAV